MKSSKASQQNRLLRIISVPVRALSKARDFYVKSMTEYADRMNYGTMAIPGSSQPNSGLPRSFSARSYNAEDLQELVRASSARSFGNRADLDLYIKKQQQTKVSSGPRAMPPRSSSVAMGRIDEDSPCCYFSEDNCKLVSAKNEVNYPRSKSHAVSARRLSGF